MNRSARPAPYRACGSATLLIAAAVFVGCVKEFALEPSKPAIVRPLEWPDTVLVTNTVPLSITITVPSNVTVTGARIAWRSSDENILRVIPGTAGDDTSSRARAEAQLHASVVARAIGSARVLARVDMPGVLDSTEYGQTIVVVEQWLSVSAGYNHSCGVTVANDAYCWGGGLRFLGDGSTLGSAVPARVVGGLSLVAVSAGWEHSCGLNVDSLLFCWGYNPWGAVGNSTTEDQLAPAPISRGPKVSSVSAGVGFTCAISDLQTALCWGDNRFGQLGSTDVREMCGADQTPCGRSWGVVRDENREALRFVVVSAGQRHACGVRTDAVGMCWGDNTRGLLGSSDSSSGQIPREVSGTLQFRTISAGPYHSCGVTTDGVAFCWGTNLFGELGSDGDVESCDGYPCSRLPRRVTTSVRFVDIRVGGRSTCGVADDATVYCWGLDDTGQLGTNVGLTICAGRVCARTPVQAADGRRFRMVSVGESHTCGIDIDGGGFCWGDNTSGKLGSGSLAGSASALRIANPRR